MPDFASRRPNAKPTVASRRPAAVAAGAKRETQPLGFQVQSKGGGPTQEKPIQVFRKLLSDFNSGLRVLSDLARNKPQEAPRALQAGGFEPLRAPMTGVIERHTHTVTSYPKPEPNIIRERTEVRTRSEPTLSVSETNVSIPAPAIVAPQTLPRRGREYNVITGADREAHRQVFEPYKAGSPHHLPSAARLAQLLRADTMMRQGALPKNQTIQNLAQAIREGRRREIADINPMKVQRLLHEAAGGPTRAQQLFFSPAIAHMVDRHNMAVQTVYNERLQSEKQRNALQIETAGPRSRKEPDVEQRVEYEAPTPMSASESDDFRAGSGIGAVVPDDNSQEASLLQMLAYNEGAHISRAAASEAERTRGHETAPMSLTRSEDRVIGDGGSSTRDSGSGIVSFTDSAGSSGTPSMSSGRGPGGIKAGPSVHPPMQVGGIAPPTHTQEETSGSGSGSGSGGAGSRPSSKPQIIKGQLTLTGHNGQSLGVADLDARVE